MEFAAVVVAVEAFDTEAVAFEQDLEVAAGLGGLHHAERVGVTGDGDVDGVVGGDLQEHAARRAAPCVLFLDEIDALGHNSRRRSTPASA